MCDSKEQALGNHGQIMVTSSLSQYFYLQIGMANTLLNWNAGNISFHFLLDTR